MSKIQKAYLSYFQTLSEEVLGGNYLQSELEEVYESLSYNLTQPNFFLMYGKYSSYFAHVI